MFVGGRQIIAPATANNATDGAVEEQLGRAVSSPIEKISSGAPHSWRSLLVSLALVLGLVLALIAVLPTAAASSFGTQTPGTSVYDSAGVLNAAERTHLEAQATRLGQAGTPAIVYIRADDRSADETMDDAKSLMADWDIESSPGAKDGFVVFINLKPGDLEHGSAAIYAGKSLHARSLPQYELDRIYHDQMLPLLKKADFAGAIGIVLTTVQHDVAFGPPPPPPPSAFERFSADAARGPLSPVNIAALLLATLGAFFALRKRYVVAKPSEPPTTITTPPGNLAPAVAGALVAGGASNNEFMIATLYDFASRGVLAVEPISEEKVRIHLLSDLRSKAEWESAVWGALRAQADEDGIIDHDQLAKLQSHWDAPKEQLRDSLIDRGWFERTVPSRQHFMYVIAGILLIFGVVALILAAVGDQPPGAIGAGILAVTGITIFVLASRMRQNTSAGETEAQPWRGLQRGLELFGKEWNDPLDLDAVMPYAVALGVAKSLEKRFEAASEDGYEPTWLGPMQFRGNPSVSSYVCWMAMNSAITPVSSGGGFSGGVGAAAGGAGAGGSF